MSSPSVDSHATTSSHPLSGAVRRPRLPPPASPAARVSRSHTRGPPLSQTHMDRSLSISPQSSSAPPPTPARASRSILSPPQRPSPRPALLSLRSTHTQALTRAPPHVIPEWQGAGDGTCESSDKGCSAGDDAADRLTDAL